MFNIKRTRGLTHPIYLIHVDLNENTLSADFHVVGTTKRIYHVIIRTQTKQVTCTCIDYMTHKEPCKHVFFVSDKILSFDLYTDREAKLYDFDTLQGKIYERVARDGNLASEEAITKYLEHMGISDDVPTTDNLKPRNDECGICYEVMSSDGLSVMVCSVCRNGIHEACYNHWSDISKKNTCIYCKRPYKDNTRFVMDDLGYYVLSS